MALFALSDLHLSLSTDKPMEVFGDRWRNHHLKIQENWNNKVSDEDVVLISGDISWAMKLNDALVDLNFIHGLKGKKVLIKGNHDYWWSSISKLNALYEDMFFIQNTHYRYGEYGICGTRGWVKLDDGEEQDEKIFKREVLRLRMSVEDAVKNGIQRIVVMMHYPPITKISRSQEFLDIIQEYNVEKVIYGHIHYDARHMCINGIYNDIQYICTSADIINFDPVRIL